MDILAFRFRNQSAAQRLTHEWTSGNAQQRRSIVRQMRSVPSLASNFLITLAQNGLVPHADEILAFEERIYETIACAEADADGLT